MAANPSSLKGKSQTQNGGEAIERALGKVLYFSNLLGTDHRIDLYERLAEFDRNAKDTAYALKRQYARFKARKDMRQAIWRDFVTNAVAGVPFSNSLSNYVPPAERLAIAAGEETGQFDEGFEMAAYIARATKELKSAITSSLAYPAILMLLFTVLMYFVSWKLVPAMLNIAPVEQWPAVSAALYTVSKAVESVGVFAMALVVGIGILNAWSMPRFVGPARAMMDKFWPPNIIYRKVEGAMFIVVLASMQKGGISLDTALRNVRQIASPWMKNHIETFQRRMTAGKEASVAINTGLLDQDVVDTLEDYDDAGSFSKALDIVGRNVVNRTIKSVKSIASVIGVFMMMLVAGGIVWTYASMALLVMGMQNRVPGAS